MISSSLDLVCYTKSPIFYLKPSTARPTILMISVGLYGIAAARSFLEIHPNLNLIILESEAVAGGTWSIGLYLRKI